MVVAATTSRETRTRYSSNSLVGETRSAPLGMGSAAVHFSLEGPR